jgi:hypothetical protein
VSSLSLSFSLSVSLSLSLSCNQRYILTRFQHNSVFFETLSCISSFLCSALRPPQLHIFCRYYFIVLQHLELSERRVSIFYVIFPRASERRVLLIVGSVICVCHTSSHLHVFTSSHTFSHLTSWYTHIFISSHIYSHLHTHIFISSYLHILTSSHLHLHIFTSSHLHILTSSHSHPSLSLSLSLSPLSPLSLSPFSLAFLLFFLSLRPLAVRTRSHETSAFSHEMRIDAQKLRKNCDFTCAGATVSHEMRVDAQKLR